MAVVPLFWLGPIIPTSDAANCTFEVWLVRYPSAETVTRYKNTLMAFWMMQCLCFACPTASFATQQGVLHLTVPLKKKAHGRFISKRLFSNDNNNYNNNNNNNNNNLWTYCAQLNMRMISYALKLHYFKRNNKR